LALPQDVHARAKASGAWLKNAQKKETKESEKGKKGKKIV
jgi:hypothetical protein